MLAIQFRFLYPHFYATDVQDPRQVEWPPHPDRVFAALVNAAYATEDPPRYRPLLHWLAQQPPPGIMAPEARPWNDSIQFVPCKIKPGTPDDPYLKAPKQNNSISLAGKELTYLWPESAPSPEQQQQLDELFGYLGYLSSPRNMATAQRLEEAGTPDYEPAATGEYALRVPHPSRLESLEHQHRMRLEEGRLNYVDPGVVWAFYRKTAAAAEPIVLANRFKRVALFRLVGAPDITGMRELAETIRDRLIACVNDRFGRVPEWIHGHASAGRRFVPHIAFAPRAAINLAGADGRLHGLALLLPITESYDRDRSFIGEALTHPDLRDFAIGRLRVFLQLHQTRGVLSTREEAYQQPSKTWATLTPVMLDRFPTKHKTVEDILAMMLEREGIPLSGAHIHYGAKAFIPGIPLAARFRRQSPYHKRPSYHLRIELAQGVPGPVTLGTTRYVGLGHFIRLDERPTS